MKPSSIFLSLAAIAVLATNSLARETPIRDRIKAKRDAIAAERQLRRDERQSKRKDRRSGKTEILKIMHDGIEREALVQYPQGSRGLSPVVIVLHGGTRGANDIFDRTSWPRVAQRNNALLVAPQGVENQWNDGRDATISGTRSTADDVGFLTKLIATLVSDHGANPRAIYVSGISNGGVMTMRFACEEPTLISAIAPVISTMPETLAPLCERASPLPALFMAGTADPLMPYDGSSRKLAKSPDAIVPMLSIPETLDLWRIKNGCSNKSSARDLPDLNKRDESTVTRIEYRSCNPGAPLVHYRINDGGHQMPSLKPQNLRPRLVRLLGPQNNDIEGPVEIWRFFASPSVK
jgi:polyhydroxybutyrate depolymerase